MLKMSMVEKLQHKYALSPKGASDMIKAFASVTLSDLVLMFPVGLLYYLVGDFINGTLNSGKSTFYIIGSVMCLALIAATTCRI